MADLFPIADPNWVTPPRDQLNRTVFRMEAVSNSFRVRAAALEPTDVFEYHLDLEGADAIKELVDWFVTTVRGRWRNVWVPSFQMDLMQASDHAANFSSLTIPFAYYTERHFPYEARRHLAFITPTTITHRRVTAAVDNGDGSETLTLDGVVATAFPLGFGMISFLRLMRLTSDILSIRYDSTFAAQCTLPFVELPNEVPTTV